MTYRLEFKKSALKEWRKLGPTIKEQFKRKIEERLGSTILQVSNLGNRICLVLESIVDPYSYAWNTACGQITKNTNVNSARLFHPTGGDSFTRNRS
nr:MAG: hypothetical protein BECKFM1743A_GA0114220_106211 [Candidatus Kentron sp. FM]